MKKFFNILLRLWCLRKARKLTSYNRYGDPAEVLCYNAESILNYIREGAPYTPEWRSKDEPHDGE